MTKHFWKSALFDIWYLVVIFLAIVLVVAYKLVAGESEPPTFQQMTQAHTASGTDVEPAKVVRQARRLTEGEKAQTLIDTYEKQLAQEGLSEEDGPALLLATGNLYRQKLQNYKEAARNYALLINEYPDWEGIAGVYSQLMACYEQLDDQKSLRWLYGEMMKNFPPESNEYEYAKANLNGDS